MVDGRDNRLDQENVAIFWDYENVCPPSGASGYAVAKKIRSTVRSMGGVITTFKAYTELSAPTTSSKTIALHSELQSSGVTLVDCPHPDKRKDVVDKMMLVDILAWAMDNPCPSTVFLVSGDRDFSYCLSVLQNRGYTVALIAPTSTHGSLREQADVIFEWTDLFPNVAVTPPKPLETESTELPLIDNSSIKPSSTTNIVTRSSIGIQCDPPPESPSTTSSDLPEDGHVGDLDCSVAAEESRRSPSPSILPADPPTDTTTQTGDTSRVSSPLIQLLARRTSSLSSPSPPADPPSIIESTPTDPPAPVEVPAQYADLITVLREARVKGYAKPTRHSIGLALIRRNPLVYQIAGISKFKPYAEMARKAGWVDLGPIDDGEYGNGWISLKEGLNLASSL